MVALRTPLEITLDRPENEAGEKISGTVVFSPRSRVEITAMTASIVGEEVIKAWEIVGTGRNAMLVPTTTRSPATTQSLRLVERSRSGSPGSGGLALGRCEAGRYELRFEEDLPASLCGSFVVRRKALSLRLEYRVRVSVALARRLDAKGHARFTLQSVAGQAARGRVAFQSASRKSSPPFQVELNSAQALRGLNVSGIVTLPDHDADKLRGLKVDLLESGTGTTSEDTHRARPKVVSSTTVPRGQAAEGVIPFSLPIPTRATPTYQGPSISIEHTLRVEADLAMARNPQARTRLVLA